MFRDRDTVLFVTALDFHSPEQPYELRLKCVELGRSASAVIENDLKVAEAYQEEIEQLRRVREERDRRLRERQERVEKARMVVWAAGLRREREQYSQYAWASLWNLLARDRHTPRVRYKGILLNWKTSFGFITFSITGATYRNAGNVFLHISDMM